MLKIELTQRAHHLVLKIEEALRPFELECALRLSGTRAYRTVDLARFGAEFDHAAYCIPLPVDWRTAALRVRSTTDGEPWATASLRNRERPKRGGASNPYWAAWERQDLELFTQLCRAALPGANERDSGNNTLGHVIAGFHTDESAANLDEFGNFRDDRGYNRGIWLGRLCGGGGLRGAGLDPDAKNKQGHTVLDVWEANDTPCVQREEYRDYLAAPDIRYAADPWG